MKLSKFRFNLIKKISNLGYENIAENDLNINLDICNYLAFIARDAFATSNIYARS